MNARSLSRERPDQEAEDSRAVKVPLNSAKGLFIRQNGRSSYEANYIHTLAKALLSQ